MQKTIGRSPIPLGRMVGHLGIFLPLPHGLTSAQLPKRRAPSVGARPRSSSCGCLISLLGFGPRSPLVSSSHHVAGDRLGRDVFASPSRFTSVGASASPSPRSADRSHARVEWRRWLYALASRDVVHDVAHPAAGDGRCSSASPVGLLVNLSSRPRQAAPERYRAIATGRDGPALSASFFCAVGFALIDMRLADACSSSAACWAHRSDGARARDAAEHEHSSCRQPRRSAHGRARRIVGHRCMLLVFGSSPAASSLRPRCTCLYRITRPVRRSAVGARDDRPFSTSRSIWRLALDDLSAPLSAGDQLFPPRCVLAASFCAGERSPRCCSPRAWFPMCSRRAATSGLVSLMSHALARDALWFRLLLPSVAASGARGWAACCTSAPLLRYCVVARGCVCFFPR